MSDATLPRDVARGVKALQVAVDALGMIAGLDGVQGDWAVDALREIGDLVCDERPEFRVVDEISPERERELREDSFVPLTERRCVRCGIRAEDAAKQAEPICSDRGLVSSHSYVDRPRLVDADFDAATGEGRR